MAQAPPQGPDLLKKGIAQVEEGDLENAVITLDDAVRRLSAEPTHEKDLATAHLYLAMAHLGLSRVENAKAEVLAAWRSNKELTLDRSKFPPTIIDMYETARKELTPDPQAKQETAKGEPTPTQLKQDAKREEPKKAAAEAREKAAPKSRPPAPKPASQTASAEKKHGSKALLWIGLGVAAAGGGVAALAAGGKGGSAKPPVVGGVTVAPSGVVGIPSVTEFTFTLSGASGFDTCTWKFGDGGTSSGITASHTYTESGSYTVQASLVNRDGTASATASVVVTALTGRWNGIEASLVAGKTDVDVWDLTQSGMAVSGTHLNLINDISASFVGALQRPRTFIASFYPGWCLYCSQSGNRCVNHLYTYSGSISDDARQITGTFRADGPCSASGLGFSLTR
jgi:hypothetical protein